MRKLDGILASVVLVGLLLAPGCTHSITDADLARTDFTSFNQRQSEGWREMARQAEFEPAATLIRRYLEVNEAALNPWQKSILRFHEAEMLACAGRTAEAIAILPQARLTPQPRGLEIDWNAMVDAVDAFLLRDRKALVAARDAIHARGDSPANRIEKARVDQLLAGFGQPYRRVWISATRTPDGLDT